MMNSNITKDLRVHNYGGALHIQPGLEGQAPAIKHAYGDSWIRKFTIYHPTPRLTRAHYHALERFAQRFYAGWDREVTLNNVKVSGKVWTKTYQWVVELWRNVFLLGDIRWDDQPEVMYTDPLRIVYEDGTHGAGYSCGEWQNEGIYQWYGIDTDTYHDGTMRLRKRSGDFYYSVGRDTPPTKTAMYGDYPSVCHNPAQRDRVTAMADELVPQLLDEYLDSQGVTLIEVRRKSPDNGIRNATPNPILPGCRFRHAELAQFAQDNHLVVQAMSNLEPTETRMYMNPKSPGEFWSVRNVEDEMAKVGFRPVPLDTAYEKYEPMDDCVAVTLSNGLRIFPTVYPVADGSSPLYVLPLKADDRIHDALQMDDSTTYEPHYISRLVHQRLQLEDRLWLMGREMMGGWDTDRTLTYTDLNDRVMEVTFRAQD